MEKLKMFLDKINYNYLIKCCNPLYYENPFPPKDAVKLNMEFFPLNLKKIISFLFLGDSILNNDFDILFPKDVIEELKLNSLIIKDCFTCKMNDYCIVSSFGNYLLTNLPYYYKNEKEGKDIVYLGFDSYSLVNFLANINYNFVKALDIGSGSGIQSIILSKKVKNVVGIDINERATKVSKLNEELNQIKNISFFNMSINKFNESNEKFDLIVSNPPFIPIGSRMNYYSTAGNGGVLGIDIIDQIIDFACNHITKNGKLVISGECLGKDNGSLIIDKFFNKLYEFGFSIRIYVLDTYTIETFLNNVGKFCKCAYKDLFSKDDLNEVKLECKKNHLTIYNKFIMFCEKDFKKTCEYIRQQAIFGNKKYRMNIDINLAQFRKTQSNYLLIYGGKNLMQLDEEAKELLLNNEVLNYEDLLKNHNKEELNSFINELLKCKIIREE